MPAPDDFAAQVTLEAEAAGWLVLRTDGARGCPTLLLLKDGALLVANVAEDAEELDDRQAGWLAAFGMVERVAVATFRPHTAGGIAARLAGIERPAGQRHVRDWRDRQQERARRQERRALGGED